MNNGTRWMEHNGRLMVNNCWTMDQDRRLMNNNRGSVNNNVRSVHHDIWSMIQLRTRMEDNVRTLNNDILFVSMMNITVSIAMSDMTVAMPSPVTAMSMRPVTVMVFRCKVASVTMTMATFK